MFTVGPRLTILPLPRSSAPITFPYSAARDRSQVAARDTPADSWVTPVSPSPTPLGPSCRFMVGTHRCGMAGMFPAPVTMLILSGNVIRDSSRLARWPAGSDRLSHGHSDVAAARGVPAAGGRLQAAASTADSATARTPAAAVLLGKRRTRRRAASSTFIRTLRCPRVSNPRGTAGAAPGQPMLRVTVKLPCSGRLARAEESPT